MPFPSDADMLYAGEEDLVMKPGDLVMLRGNERDMYTIVAIYGNVTQIRHLETMQTTTVMTDVLVAQPMHDSVDFVV